MDKQITPSLDWVEPEKHSLFDLTADQIKTGVCICTDWEQIEGDIFRSTPQLELVEGDLCRCTAYYVGWAPLGKWPKDFEPEDYDFGEFDNLEEAQALGAAYYHDVILNGQGTLGQRASQPRVKRTV